MSIGKRGRSRDSHKPIENTMNTTIENKVNDIKPVSAWKRGVKEYALELIDAAEIELTLENAKEVLLNGAKDWSQYSYGGCAMIYDADIAERLCSPSELKRKKGGDLQPNPRESWLDVQTRALKQACNLIKSQFIHNLES